ncbi:hypothetical protein PAMA_014780 [Pampus argenteus]
MEEEEVVVVVVVVGEALASFDLCASHGLAQDPMPVRDEENSHGTQCAGVVAMEANNSYCGVGIAFNARIGGIRLLYGSVTDAMEATALTFNIGFIDIYVCSWGPQDDGAEMDGPHSLTEQALRLGAHKAQLCSPSSHCCLSDGRGGKGSIFLWASGNGGMQHDHCGADGYVNSIYSIAIGAVTQTGKPAYFGEPCPGTMAVTLTGAGVVSSLPLVTATNIGEGCVTHFPGTSSAAPTAAGILALVLEANPELTWRDVQHLIAKTAKIPDPKEPGWNINAAGYHVHHRGGEEEKVMEMGEKREKITRIHPVPLCAEQLRGLPGPTEPNYQNKPATTTCREEREGGREEDERGEEDDIKQQRGSGRAGGQLPGVLKLRGGEGTLLKQSHNEAPRNTATVELEPEPEWSLNGSQCEN